MCDAQQIGRPSQGLVLAERFCAQCHAVQKDRQSTNASAPPFGVIAAIPGMTTIALVAALNTSHRTMPNINLSPDDQADIVAYILGLK